jgi:hypothetical protein
MADTYLPAFHACVAKGRASSIMCSYNSINGVPACADEDLLNGLARCVPYTHAPRPILTNPILTNAIQPCPALPCPALPCPALPCPALSLSPPPPPPSPGSSGEWRFDGYITSDCGAVADIWNRHNYTATPEEACGVALRAGTDLDCSTFYKDHALAALASGDVAEADVDAALRHLFRVQFRLGLFDPSESQVYTQVRAREGASERASDWAPIIPGWRVGWMVLSCDIGS